jgi:hypothetical protein
MNIPMIADNRYGIYVHAQLIISMQAMAIACKSRVSIFIFFLLIPVFLNLQNWISNSYSKSNLLPR